MENVMVDGYVPYAYFLLKNPIDHILAYKFCLFVVNFEKNKAVIYTSDSFEYLVEKMFSFSFIDPQPKTFLDRCFVDRNYSMLFVKVYERYINLQKSMLN